MADTFFGFNTALTGSLEDELNDEPGQGLDEEEEEYDALNDETFGTDAVVGDWEEDHEKLAEITEQSRVRHGSYNNDSQVESDDQADLDLEASISQLVLDDFDDQLLENGDSTRTDTQTSPHLTSGSSGADLIDSPSYSSSAPSGYSVWGVGKHDPQHKTSAQSVLSNVKNVCTVEELERGLISQRNAAPVSLLQGLNKLRLEDVERDLTTSNTGAGTSSNFPVVNLGLGRGQPQSGPFPHQDVVLRNAQNTAPIGRGNVPHFPSHLPAPAPQPVLGLGRGATGSAAFGQVVLPSRILGPHPPITIPDLRQLQQQNHRLMGKPHGLCNFTGCHWSFYTYFKLKRHKETHLKRKDFVCPIKGCERRFTTIYNLNTHQKLHARPLEMVCPVETCAARFQTKRSLELHLKGHDTHHAPYRCSFEGCGKHYYSLNSLNSHSRSHQHKDEEVRCQWEGCGKLFDKPCRLKAHMRSHTGDKPYPCTYQDCGWAFPSASKLKRHQRKHTNERKFQCDIEGCGKSFMRSEHLREHTLTHVGQRNFQCPLENCGVKFSAKSSLYVHLKKHNKTESDLGDRVVYHCPIEKCTRTYTCKSSLRQHMLKFHTPVLANDPSQLDYIALLTGDDDLGALEGLQFSGDVTPTVNGGINCLSAVSLVTPPSMMINGGEGMGSIPPEYINTDFQFPGMMPTQLCGNVSSGVGCTSGTNNSVITHVVLSPPEAQNSSYTMSNSSISAVETNQPDIVDTTDQPLNIPVFEPVALDVGIGTSSLHGSARTSFTYQDIVRDRNRRKGNTSPTTIDQSTSTTSMRVPTDVVLGTGLLGSSQDIAHSFLLQDDLSTNHHSLYPEDHMMTVGAGVGEFQVLLLDPSNNTRHEFAESTINLRDLE